METTVIIMINATLLVDGLSMFTKKKKRYDSGNRPNFIKTSLNCLLLDMRFQKVSSRNKYITRMSPTASENLL